jgi:hypothetical protein
LCKFREFRRPFSVKRNKVGSAYRQVNHFSQENFVHFKHKSKKSLHFDSKKAQKTPCESRKDGL